MLAATDAVGEPVESGSLATAQVIGHVVACLAPAPGFGCVPWRAKDGG